MKLVLYTQTTCRYCPQVQNYLEEQGINFETINLSMKEDKYDLGIMSTPTTVLIDDGEEIVRYAGTDTKEIDVLISQL